MEEKFKHIKLDLRRLPDCRFYLNNLKMKKEDGTMVPLTHVQFESGESKAIADLSDSEVIQYANQAYRDLELPSRRANSN